MKPAPDRIRRRVTIGNSHLTVYRWTHPATGKRLWRYAWRDGERTRYKTCQTRAEAEESAAAVLRGAGGLAWEGLDDSAKRFLADVHRATSPGDRPAVLAFLAGRDSSCEIGAAVERFAVHKTREAGEVSPWLRQVLAILSGLAGHFAGRRLSDITAADLAGWHAERSKGLAPKTAKDFRAAAVMFWRWAMRQGIAGNDPITPADRLATSRPTAHAKRVLSPAELCAILDGIGRQWRAWAILGAFAGLRPEEICPSRNKRIKKRGLRCEEIDWEFGVIRVAPEVSKVGRARIVPLSDACRAGLLWADIEPGMTGRVCLTNPANKNELLRLGDALFGGRWPQDALRHSYGSYRNAQLRNLQQVAEEMGNSVAMLERHYHNPRSASEGAAWFGLRPSNGIWSLDSLRVPSLFR